MIVAVGLTTVMEIWMFQFSPVFVPDPNEVSCEVSSPEPADQMLLRELRELRAVVEALAQLRASANERAVRNAIKGATGAA
jgi:hypothetical protein